MVMIFLMLCTWICSGNLTAMGEDRRGSMGGGHAHQRPHMGPRPAAKPAATHAPERPTAPPPAHSVQGAPIPAHADPPTLLSPPSPSLLLPPPTMVFPHARGTDDPASLLPDHFRTMAGDADRSVWVAAPRPEPVSTPRVSTPIPPPPPPPSLQDFPRVSPPPSAAPGGDALPAVPLTRDDLDHMLSEHMRQLATLYANHLDSLSGFLTTYLEEILQLLRALTITPQQLADALNTTLHEHNNAIVGLNDRLERLEALLTDDYREQLVTAVVEGVTPHLFVSRIHPHVEPPEPERRLLLSARPRAVAMLSVLTVMAVTLYLAIFQSNDYHGLVAHIPYMRQICGMVYANLTGDTAP